MTDRVFATKRLRSVVLACISLILTSGSLKAQLNENCTVSILNHTTQVQADGSWHIDNIPAGFGFVRARATCVQNGQTQFGQSDLFQINAFQVTGFSANIVLGSTTPIPTSLAITTTGTTLNKAGQTNQLTVTASYSDETTKDVTPASSGTLYTISNPAIATITPDGLITAVSSGTVIVQALHEGTQAIASIKVVLGDVSHGGIPDSWAIAHGLDPNDPNMPFEDPDHDGLNNLQEFQNGTDPHNPDTDNDGLTDGQEVLIYHTNPLLLDTDGDGVPDGLEVLLGTDPLDPNSFDYGRAVGSMEIRAPVFNLVVNSLNQTASTQLSVIGHLIDGHLIDLTSTRRLTHYSSSDLNICNFGSPDGTVFAGNAGTCTITATNSGHTATAQGIVQNFSPSSVSFVPIPGFANGVAVSGQFAYVAAGGAGLQIVNLSPDRTNPQIVSSLAIPGNANDITLVGNLGYLAMGPSGLAVVDVTNPLSPQLVGTLNLSGNAMDVTVKGTTAFVANGSNLVLVDTTNPASPKTISTLALNGNIQGVDVDTQRNLAVVTAGTNGIYAVDISNQNAPVVLGTTSTGDARDVAIRGNFAFVADFQNSATSVDITNPSAPVVLSHILDPNLGGFLQDIVLSGNFALGADAKFVNGIPITDISDPTNLQARAILNFPQRDDNAMGIAVDSTFVYLATEHSSITKGGSFGDSRLYIGQYQIPADNAGIPPTATITAPAPGSLMVEGSIVRVQVAATDDIKVAAVNFLVNGQVVFTTTTAPYQFVFAAPANPGPMVLGATAVDLGNNVGTAQNVVVNVIPDPGTSIAGRVVDINGNPIFGATVTTTGGHSAISNSDGSFLIGDAPTATGSLAVNATVLINGVQLSGSSASATPVPLGITNVGDIPVMGVASFVQVPGFASAVAVLDDFGFVAAGGQGLQIINLSHDRTNPQVVGSLAIPGNANDITLVGNRAYLAMGPQGLAVVDVTNPLTPQLLGTLKLSGNAMGITVRATTAFVAAQPQGNPEGCSDAAAVANTNSLILVDVSRPGAMNVISTTKLNGRVWGVDVDASRHLAVVAAGFSGIFTIDFTNPTAPTLLATMTTGNQFNDGSADSIGVSIKGNFALVADRVNSMTAVDISDPANPFAASQTPPAVGGQLNDIALSGNFALGADVSFNTAVPIVDISNPTKLQGRAVLSFANPSTNGDRNDHGIGIATDNNFVYLATDNNSFDKGGSFGDARVYIGRFQVLQDTAGIAPVVSIASPVSGASIIAGTTIRMQVNASDDVGVPAVNFLINGQVVFTASASPYEYTFTAPTTVGLITLGATAVDLGGNVGTAQDVQINVIADPGTTLTGRVVDGNGTPISGALISISSTFSGVLSGFSMTTADGTFSVSGVPTIAGNISANVTVNASGSLFSAKSTGFTPVVGGITNVGDIVIPLVSQWTQVSPAGSSPAARFELGQATYDEITDRMIIFGGLPEFGILNDVWVLNHASATTGQPQWIKLDPAPDPTNGLIPVRSDNAAVYDGAHNRLIIFGGFTECVPPFEFECGVGNDVWILDNANGLGGQAAWTKLTPQGVTPTKRADSAVAYDPATNTMMLFGGQGFTSNGGFGTFTEVWTLSNPNGLNGTPTWNQLAPSGGPPTGPVSATAVYDAASNRMTIFGGTDANELVSKNAVWILTNANGQGGDPQWINLVPEGAPGAPAGRSFHSAIYDPAVNRMTTFGGTPDFNTYFSDTWILPGANGLGDSPSWFQVASTGTPDGRCCHVAVFDPASNRMIMFGGLTFEDIVGDTWILSDANGLATFTTNGGTVSGQVTFAGGAPAPNALVRISTADQGTTFSKETRTDANGGYVVSSVPVGRAFTVRAFDPEGISFKDSSANTISSAGQSLTINLALPAVATVQIKVIGADGAPVTGARILVQDSFKTFMRLAGFTDANGILNVSVPEGSFSMQAQEPNLALILGTFAGQVAATDSGATITGTIASPPLPAVPRVLVASGIADINTGVYTDTSELFDPATGTWTPVQNSIPNKPPDSAAGFCAANMAALGDGRMLFAGGGCSDEGVTTNATSLYIQGPNQWFSPHGMFFGRDQFAMVTLSNGNALAFAGCAGGCSGPNILGQGISQVGSSSEIYDFHNNSWNLAGSLNQGRGNMGNGTFSQTAATLLDGRVLACNGSDGFSTSFDSCEIYDPVADQWAFTGSIGETGAHPLAVLPGGKVLAIMNDGLAAQLFDPSGGTWAAAASLNSPQSHGILITLKTGEVLLSGGSDGNGPVNTVQIYHPSTDSWTTTAAMSAARSGHVAVLLDDGRILVAGGLTTNSVILNSAEIFDPTSATWSATAPMSQPRMGASAVKSLK